MFMQKNKNLSENIDEIYFKSLEKTNKNIEYIKNKEKINIIKKTIIEKTDTPEDLIDLLIEYVEENTAIEYELANKKIYDFLLKKI